MAKFGSLKKYGGMYLLITIWRNINHVGLILVMYIPETDNSTGQTWADKPRKEFVRLTHAIQKDNSLN